MFKAKIPNKFKKQEILNFIYASSFLKMIDRISRIILEQGVGKKGSSQYQLPLEIEWKDTKDMSPSPYPMDRAIFLKE